MHKCLYTSKSVGVAWGTLASLAQRLATCEQMCMLLSFVSPWQALPKGFLHVFEKVLLHVSPWQALSKGLLHVEQIMRVKTRVKTWVLLGGFLGVGIDFAIDFSWYFGHFFY